MGWKRYLPYINIALAGLLCWWSGYWYAHAWWAEGLSDIPAINDRCADCSVTWYWYAIGYGLTGLLNAVAAIIQIETRTRTNA